ncbi:hypothetical protein BJ875DRAFT_214889 [Amylocarpus encephaloides]|uniref:Uncharacterized protein n=1 Tax=Amylocarpus encephaloides TaxID=45428 RepID=A0A9P7Y904_9HELO|nr:hypothetical protein BJ875DRAFT_214889 [Amylocarpus encephaloides]
MSPPRSSAALSSQNIIEVGSSPESSPDPVAQPLRPVASASTSPQRSARNTGDLATELPPVDVLLEIINKASPSNPQFKGPALHNTMYQEWSLWWPSVAKGIVRLHASEVLMKLPPAWKGTKLHDDLKVMAKEVPPARRSKEMKAAAQDGRVPAQRRGMPTSDIHKISDSDWFYNAAAYLTVKRRLKKCQTRVTPTPPVTKGKRQTGELDEGMENYIGTLDAAPVANSHAAANSRSVAAQHDLSTREGRKAAHKVWLETITSRTRSPSPDRGSYNYQLAVRSLHEAKVAQVTGSPNVSKSQLRPQFAPDGNTPHSQKALPHTFEGKPSGKGSRLKPKSSKRPTDDGSPDDRHRKRARLSASPSSEMDEDPESPTPLRRSSSRSRSPSFNDEEPIDDDPDNPFKPSTLNMTRGPLGILRCRTFQCHFVENNPDTTQGRARMEAHYEVHRKEDPMIVLAREEAKLNGRKVSYLMEKIQKMEAEEKSKDDGGKGKGRLGGEKVVLDSFGQPFPARIIRRIGGIGG